MDIQKEVGYTINGTEVGFFGVILQNEPKLGIVPTYISMGNPTPEIKIKLADSLIRFAENIKRDIKTDNTPLHPTAENSVENEAS